jgi:hypothetical protein
MDAPVQLTLLRELKALLDAENYNDLEVLRHCIGLETIHTEPSDDRDVANVRSIADQLAEHMLVVCIDTEHYTLNSDEMTEIGVAIMPVHEVRELSQAKQFGDHGLNLMEQAKFHFWRLREKAHLHTTNVNSRGPAGNRFGEVRFISFEQAREYLRKIMKQPIENVKGLEGYNHPVVILGHSIAHDREHLNGKDLDLSVTRLDTIIRYIDTQTMTTEAGYWWGSRDPIGLRTLVEKFEFTHSDSHTAANDVGRTLICAFLLALSPNHEARTGCTRTINQAAVSLEVHSRITFEPMGGTPDYCCNCGSTKHMGDACPRVGKLRCDGCVSRGLMALSTTHIKRHCPIVRDEVAAERLAWYAGQPKEWAPKYPFTSKSRLKTYEEFPVPGVLKPATQEEITERRTWYDQGRRGSDGKLLPFVWKGRSFERSHLRNAPAPPGQRITMEQLRQRMSADQLPSTALPTPPPPLTESNFPPLSSHSQNGTGSRGGFRGGRGGLHSGLSRGSFGRGRSAIGGTFVVPRGAPAQRAVSYETYLARKAARESGGRGRGDETQ